MNKIIAARLTEEDEKPVNGNSSAFFRSCGILLAAATFRLAHDPWLPVFPCDRRATRLRGDHAQTKRQSWMTIRRKVIAL
jgi:hypothetical protein